MFYARARIGGKPRVKTLEADPRPRLGDFTKAERRNSENSGSIRSGKMTFAAA